MTTTLEAIKSVILYLTLFIFPLIFLPLTEEFYNSTKMYFLIFTVLSVLTLSMIQFLLKHKLVWQSSPLDLPVILTLTVSISSLLIITPNKIQSLLEPFGGLAILLTLTIFYFILTQVDSRQFHLPRFVMQPLTLSALAIAVMTIIMFLNPLSGLDLKFPPSWQFLQSRLFTPLGKQTDLMIFLGYFVVYKAVTLATIPAISKKMAKNLISLSILIILIIATFISIYILSTSQSVNPLPPLSLSIMSAAESLKDPLSAIFGVGTGNFVMLFTQAKTTAYNMTPLWQINFTQSRSFILQILSEGGILSLAALLITIASAIRMTVALAIKNRSLAVLYGSLLAYLVTVMLLFPPSLPLLFLFYITLAILSHEIFAVSMNTVPKSLDLKPSFPFVAAISAISLVLIISITYLAVRAYKAEYLYKRSLDALVKNQAADAYQNHREAIAANPFVERFRTRFAQLNLTLATNIAQSAQNGKKLSDKDQQQMSAAIQAAISEAKSAVALNSEKSSHWQNLATVYRNILTGVQGADAWAIAAYERAIALDPVSPVLRINLGGVYYALENYKQAQKLFQQAIVLKPNLANAHYNLAWALYNRGEYKEAVKIMQTVLTLVDKKSNDYQKATNELKEFRTHL